MAPFFLSSTVHPLPWAMDKKEVDMRNKRAARHSCNYDRAYMSVTRDIDSIAEFERVTWCAGMIIAVVFGVLFFWGLM